MNKYKAKHRYVTAKQLFAKQDYAGALYILEVLDESFPNHTEFVYGRALALFKLDRLEEAKVVCKSITGGGRR